MTRRHARPQLNLGAVALVLATAACHGRGLVDEGYPGHALATAQGSLAATAEPVREELSLAIAWLPSAAAERPLTRVDALLGRASGDLSQGTGCLALPLFDAETSPDGLVVQPVSHTSALPFQFKFSVLSAPPREAELGRERRASIGLVVAYVDANDSGVLDRAAGAPDRLVALSADRSKTALLVFTESGAPAAWASSKPLDAAPPGFSVSTLGEAPSIAALDDAYFELSAELLRDGRVCP